MSFRLSLVTYTYNDHAFATDLLRYSKGFGIPFHEILIVDDGSHPPLSLPEDAPAVTQTITMPTNAGPVAAKKRGINAATGDIILSLDADIRPHPAWLKHAMQYMLQPDIGIVGATCAPKLGPSYLMKARYTLGQPLKTDDDVKGVGGGVMLLRKGVWDAIGGLENFDQLQYEDYHLCQSVRAHGLRIIRANTYPTYEIRQLHRRAYCMRVIAYYRPFLQTMMQSLSYEKLLSHRKQQFEAILAYALKKREPVICYVALLKTTALFCSIANSLGQKEKAAAIIAGTLSFLSCYPTICELLLEDLEALKLLKNTPITSHESFTVIANFFAEYQQKGILDALENEWIFKIRQEDASGIFDFHYLTNDTKK